MKQKTTVILIAAMLAGTLTAYGGEPEKSQVQGYPDVAKTDWFYDSVSALSRADTLSGHPDGTFRPEGTVTYGEFITMAVKVAKNTAAAAVSPGAVSTESSISGALTHWAKPYYEQGLALGYFTPYDIPETALDIAIPRSHMALICSKALGELDSSKTHSALLESIPDVDSKTPYEYDIIKTYSAGILGGYPDGTFRPRGVLTRAESASVIWRLMDESKRAPVDAAAVSEKTQAAAKKEARMWAIFDGEGPMQTDDERTEAEHWTHAHAAKIPMEERLQTILSGKAVPIAFDPKTDIRPDGAMKEDKSREYMDQLLASVKFYREKGKYYVTGTYPKLPEGFRWNLYVNISYERSVVRRPIWSMKTGWCANPDAKVQDTGTFTRQIPDMKALKEVSTAYVHFNVRTDDETNQGVVRAGYHVVYQDDEGLFVITREKLSTQLPYDLTHTFVWK